MNKSKTIELDKILPEDVINVIDDIVTHLMADELHPAKKEEPTVEDITENPNELFGNSVHPYNGILLLLLLSHFSRVRLCATP